MRREIVHEASSVGVTDALDMKTGPTELVVPLYTPRTPELLEPGVVQLAADAAQRKLHLRYDASAVEYACTRVELKDQRLQSVWGPILHRMELRRRTPDSRARMTLRFD